MANSGHGDIVQSGEHHGSGHHLTAYPHSLIGIQDVEIAVLQGSAVTAELLTMAATADSAAAQPISEPRWPATVAVLVAMALYMTLPAPVIAGHNISNFFRFFVPGLELLLLIPLAVTAPRRSAVESGVGAGALIMTGIVSFANITALGFLIALLLDPHSSCTGANCWQPRPRSGSPT